MRQLRRRRHDDSRPAEQESAQRVVRHSERPADQPGGWNVLAADADSAEKIAAELEAKQAHIKKVAALVARFDQGDDAADALTDELDGLNASAKELRERHAGATRSAETLRADLERLRDALSLGGAYERPEQADEGELDRLARRAVRFLDFWNGASVEEKRDTIGAIFERIELGDGLVTMTFRYGLPPAAVQLERNRADSDTRALGRLGFGPKRKEEGESGPEPTSVSMRVAGVGRTETEAAYRQAAREWCAERTERRAGACRG